MDNLDDYRIKLREIADYAFNHGIKRVGIEQFEAAPPDEWDESIQTEFYNACNDGFKIAQELLIEEIKKYQNFIRESTVKLKESRRKRDKEDARKIQLEIDIAEQRLHNFSHIADGIVWQLIGGQIHIAKRFYIQDKSSKFLDSSNLDHAIHAANEINKISSDFALISDLTGFVQIGDLLVRRRSKLQIVELKEGKVNDQIINYIDERGDSDNEMTDEELKLNFDDTTIKQIKRMQRQQQRASRAADLINNDEGVDPISEAHITVSTPKVVTVRYHDELYKLQEDLNERTWAYTVIDDCLHVGMYRDQSLNMAGYAIREIIKMETNNYVVIDWLSITRNLSEPLFAKPLPAEFMIDILTGKVKVVIGINVDKLIETFNYFGLSARWLTEKETARWEQKSSGKGLFKVNKRGIIVTLPTGEEALIYGGILSKILYDTIKPSNIAVSLLSAERPATHKNKLNSSIGESE